MGNPNEVGLIAAGVAFFSIILASRMVAAKIAPKWLERFVAPPSGREH